MHTLRHDLRNFLAAIEGYSYLLKEEYNLDYLNRIFGNISNINELIDRSVLLADADLTIENKTEINLNAVIKSCNQIIPESIRLETDALPEVYGDYTRIHQVFKSVLQNAVGHGKPKIIKIKGQKIADDAFLIQIINDGTKLSPEKEKKLFTQLPQSLKPNAGLSLIIAKKILQAHNWDISYNSSWKEGTCFEILIPKESLIN